MELKLTEDKVEKGITSTKKVGVRPMASNDLKAWRNELDAYYDIMRSFDQYGLDEILKALSSMTSRASQIRSFVVRSENRSTQAFRTRELDPFIEECDRQFKIWSRMLSIHSMDWEMSRKDN